MVGFNKIVYVGHAVGDHFETIILKCKMGCVWNSQS